MRSQDTKAIVKVLPLSKSITKMEADELIEVFGTARAPKCDGKALMRALILNAHKYPADSETRSLRGFWYKYIKPALSAMGYLEEIPGRKVKPGRSWSQHLSQGLEALVSEEQYQYSRDFAITDESRELNHAPLADVKESKPYLALGGFQHRGRVYPEIILAVEKDSEYSTVEGIARLLGCSAISGHGEPSLAAMEKLLLPCAEQLGGHRVVILALVDYDPHGYSIAKAFKDQARSIMRNLDLDPVVDLRRIGITPHQLSAKELSTAKYQLVAGDGKESQLEKWMKETGGIDGERYGLELDALPRSRIRRLFSTSIARLVDQEEILSSESRRDFIAGIVAVAIEERVLAISEKLFKRYDSKIEFADVDLFALAEAGQSWYSTRSMFTTKSEKAIGKAALKALSDT